MSKEQIRMPSHRFMILGGRDSGKSSLVKSLTSGVSQLCRTPTEGVEVTEWRPCEQFVTSEAMREMNIEEPAQINIEIWDMTGRMCCWSIHQEYFSYSTTYLVTFNWQRQTSIDAALSLLKLIQQKVPGSQVILISTHSASIGYGKDSQSIKLDIKTEIEEWETNQTNTLIDQLSNVQEWSGIGHTVSEKQSLEDLLSKTLRVHPDILDIDMEHSQGLEACTRAILKVGLGRPGSHLLQRSTLPPITNPMSLMVKLAELRSRHKIVVSKASKDLNMAQDILNLLCSAGQIMKCDTPTLDEKNHLCIDPKQLAHATCLFHFDDLSKNFKFEAYRFWPKESGVNRPDPSVLVSALEEIPTYGVIREALFPLLWQEKQYSEEQIKLIISILTEQNLIYQDSQSNQHTPVTENHDIKSLGDEDLFLPNYPSLSPQTKYYLPLLGSLSDIRPGVNWSEELFEDDIHFGLVFTFPNKDITESVAKKLLVRCCECAQGQSYRYLWERGVLCKYNDEVTTNIYYDDDQRCISASARGPYEVDDQLLAIMWMTLKPMFKSITSTLSECPGIVYAIDLEARGSPLLTQLSAGKKKKSLRSPFWKCAHTYNSGQSTLQSNGLQLNLDMIFDPIKDDFFRDTSSGTWIEALLPHSCLDDFLIIQKPGNHEHLSDNNTRQRPSKRTTGNVNWKSEISQVIDMEKKRQEEESRPHIVPDKVMRRQVRRIAHSLVTSVITSAIVTVLVSKGKITQQQEPLVELVAGAVTAGHRGDTILAVESINKAMRLIHRAQAEQDAPRKSKVCIIL